MKDYRRAGAVMTAAALLAFFGMTAGTVLGAAREAGKIQQLASAFEAPEETEEPDEEEFWPEALKGEAPEEEYRPEEEDGLSGCFQTRQTEDGTLEIISCSASPAGRPGELIIPEEIDGNKVTGIAKGAFAGCRAFKSVHLPASVTAIAEGAFDGCPVQTLTGDSNEHWQVEDGVLYGEGGVLLWYPKKRSGKVYKIREGTVRIADAAFADCTGLLCVTLPDGLQSVGSRAFEGCVNLREPALPASLGEIGNRAFARCGAIKKIYLPAALKKLGEGAFAGSGVAAFEAAEGLSEYSVSDGVLFSGKGKVLYAYPAGAPESFYKVPEPVAMIAPGAFAGCGLQRVFLPENLTVIGQEAFRESDSLKSIRIPAKVIYAGEGVFRDCRALEMVRWEAYTDLVARDMFRGCVSLKEISLPVWIRSIDEGAFADCASLKSVHLGSGLQQLGAYAFDGCPSLKTLTMPVDLFYIDENALGDPFKQKILLKVAKSSYSEIWARKRGFSRHAMPLSKFERYLQKEEPSGWENLDEEQKQKEYEKPEIIRQVQIILNGAGFDCGKADGVAGKRTREAVRRFREERSMEGGEEIDETLLRSMGIEPTAQAGAL